MHFHISIWIFCTLFACLVFDDLLQSICFQMFCSLLSKTRNHYVVGYDCVDIFYIKFRFCETCAVTKSGLLQKQASWRKSVEFRIISFCQCLYLWTFCLNLNLLLKGIWFSYNTRFNSQIRHLFQFNSFLPLFIEGVRTLVLKERGGSW